MGNVASYFSGKELLEEYVIGQTDEKIVDGSHHTPARCGKIMAANQLFDPRSPTFDIDRTPIVFQVEDDGPMDPRSPSFGITRTPVNPTVYEIQDVEATNEKEREGLIQVLNFADLDCLSLSNIEEDDSAATEEFPVQVITEDLPVPMITAELPAPFIEETLDFSSLVIAASSTPTSSPVKISSKSRRPVTNNVVVDENSFGKSNSPVNGGNSLLARPRVPFGDVNRPSLASPRLQLQHKQRHVVRTEILQHQQRYCNKND